jgi:hypothetical protein
MAAADRSGPIADAAVADLEAIRSQLDREIRRALLNLDTKPGVDTLVKQQGRVAAQVASQIDARLQAMGVEPIAGVLRGRAVESALAALGGIDLLVSAQQEIDQIVTTQTREIAAVFAESGDIIRRAIALGTTTSASRRARFTASLRTGIAGLRLGKKRCWSIAFTIRPTTGTTPTAAKTRSFG